MKIEWETQDIYAGRCLSSFTTPHIWMISVQIELGKEFYALVNLTTGITNHGYYDLREFIKRLNQVDDFIPMELKSKSDFEIGVHPNHINALKQIRTGAEKMIRNEENMKIYARDIRVLAETALKGKEIPQYFNVQEDEN